MLLADNGTSLKTNDALRLYQRSLLQLFEYPLIEMPYKLFNF